MIQFIFTILLGIWAGRYTTTADYQVRKEKLKKFFNETKTK